LVQFHVFMLVSAEPLAIRSFRFSLINAHTAILCPIKYLTFFLVVIFQMEILGLTPATTKFKSSNTSTRIARNSLGIVKINSSLSDFLAPFFVAFFAYLIEINKLFRFKINFLTYFWAYLMYNCMH
jgi:hypothetical protein